MKLEPRLLQRHLHEAAVEQLTAALQADGYEVQREARAKGEAGRGVVFDLLARRDGEKAFYEIKVLGEDREAGGKNLGALAAAARKEGGRFRVIVVRPGRDVDVQVEGIEEALRSALEEDPTGELGVLGDRFAVEDIEDVEIERLQVEAGGEVRVVGTAVASVSQFAEGGETKIADSSFPFGFDVALDRDGRIRETPAPHFELDLSSWYGDEDGA